MAAGYSLVTLADFRGGLNYRTDQFDIAENESPDLLNVSVDPRGGVAMREGVTSYNQAAHSANFENVFSYYNDNGTNKVLANSGTKVYVFNNSTKAFDDIDTGSLTDRTNGTKTYGVTINNRLYGVSGDKVSFYYNGTSGNDLGTTLDGSAGNFPIAQYVAHWNNFAWVGNTVESSTAHKTRIRFSNANLPEQWDDLDFIDIGKGEGGDYITGIVGHNDRLMIFKSNSTYALFGFDGDSFQLVTVSEKVGSIPLSSPVSTPYGVFFWHDQEGVYLYDGTNTRWIFEKLKPAIDDGRFTFANPPQLAWANNKLYVSLDFYNADTNSTERRMCVFDPTTNSWVLWDVDASALNTHQAPNAAPVLYGATTGRTVGGTANTGRVISIDAGGTDADRYIYASGAYESVGISSFFQTAWIKTKNPIVRKRWGQIRLITSAEQTGTLGVEIFHDYDTSTAARTDDVSITGRAGASSVWGTATWQLGSGESGTAGNGIWSAGTNQQVTDIAKLKTGGTAAAICIKITGPTTEQASWEVNGMAFPYKARRMR